MLGVVIPTWNAKEDLSLTLGHFARLPDRVKSKMEIVISDGASTTERLRLLRHSGSRWPCGLTSRRWRVRRHESRATLLCAPWVWFMGAGDIPDEERWTFCYRFFQGRVEMHAFNVRGREPLEPGVHEFSLRNGPSCIGETPCIIGTDCPNAFWSTHCPRCIGLGDYAWCLDRLRDGAHLTCHDAPALAAVQSGGLSESSLNSTSKSGKSNSDASPREQWRLI